MYQINQPAKNVEEKETFTVVEEKVEVDEVKVEMGKVKEMKETASKKKDTKKEVPNKKVIDSFKVDGKTKSYKTLDDLKEDFKKLYEAEGKIFQKDILSSLDHLDLSDDDMEKLYGWFNQEDIVISEDDDIEEIEEAEIDLMDDDDVDTESEEDEYDSDITIDVSDLHTPTTQLNDPVKMYLKEIGRVPLLKAEDEIEIAKRIEGQPRQTSIHAAGVVMSDQDLTDHIPLKYGEDMFVTQYDAHAVEANGLLKMDFLGLRNLTFVQKMKEAVYEKYQEEIVIEAIDLEDPETLALFAAGDTKGIFQFEQAGAIRLLRRVRPNHFEEVVATTSLNRPGASDYIDNFVKRKHGQEKVDILDPAIEEILRPTYGIMLYQEQVMQVAQRFAGFSLGKADILRRAMGKKNAAEMHQMEDDFVSGALKLGHTEEKAKEVFAIMEKFAGYGFNRSHAYAYSALAFQMAYFKVHYPDVFFDVMLNYSSSDYLTDALQFDFKVAPLSINTIPYRDKFQDRKIYLGMKNIKGLPRDLAYWIIDNRPFESVEDFILRLPNQYHKLPLLTPLVELGLFDIFEKNRRKVLHNLPNLFVFADELGSLFADSNYSWTEAEDFSQAEKYEKEEAIIGVGLSTHPLIAIGQTSPYEIQPISQLIQGEQVRILIEVQSIRTIRTKSGDLMAFLQVSDTKKKLDVTLFPETYNRFSSLIKEGGFYYLTGKIQERDGRLQMILAEAQLATNEKFWIQLLDHRQDKTILSILKKYPGPYPVILRYEDEKKTLQLKGYTVQKNKELEDELKNLVMKTIYR